MLVRISILLCGTDLLGVLYILSIALLQRRMLLMLFILLLRHIARIPIMPGWRMVMATLSLVSDGVLVRGERLPLKGMIPILYS